MAGEMYAKCGGHYTVNSETGRQMPVFRHPQSISAHKIYDYVS